MRRKLDVLLVLAPVCAWLGLVAAGVALAAWSAVEPPFWDALSYAEKSKNFWDNVAAGKWVNPLNIPRSMRPPGVIPVSYPFGFTLDFHGFYFRWIIVPVVLLAAAVVVGGWAPAKPPAFKVALLALVLVLAGMPFLYQFQPNAILNSQSNWGLVDGFLASLTAFATAAVLRSVRGRSIGWAAAAFAVAAYGLFVKPSGLLLMGLIGLSWLVVCANAAGWRIAALRDDRTFRRYVIGGLAIASAIYAWAVHAAFTSEYYSSQNIAFGLRNLEIFRQEAVYDIDLELVATLLHRSLGWLVFVVIGLGIAMAVFRPRALAHGVMALICLVVGVWFWIFTTNIGDVRYFFPFATIAFMLMVPSVLALAESLPQRVVVGASALAVAPALIVTVMLFLPSPPVGLQRWLGVNLFTNLYQAENEQAAKLIADVEGTEKDIQRIYIFDVSPVTRSFGAVLDYHDVLNRGNVRFSTILPVDWSRGLSFRFDEVVSANYLAFEPINNAAAREQILAWSTVPDYPSQARIMNAWATTIGPDDGVELVSETRLRLLRVVDRDKLAASLVHFAVRYEWPETFRTANDARWWKPRSP